MKPKTGESSPGITTLSHTPSHCDAVQPGLHDRRADEAAEQCVRRARRQADVPRVRFHTIAPISAARIVCSVTRSVSMIPWPTVFATAVVTNAPARFATAAIVTACRGDRARVETEVAIAFAVSWKPFVKSNASAVTMTATRRTSTRPSA